MGSFYPYRTPYYRKVGFKPRLAYLDNESTRDLERDPDFKGLVEYYKKKSQRRYEKIAKRSVARRFTYPYVDAWKSKSRPRAVSPDPVESSEEEEPGEYLHVSTNDGDSRSVVPVRRGSTIPNRSRNYDGEARDAVRDLMRAHARRSLPVFHAARARGEPLSAYELGFDRHRRTFSGVLGRRPFGASIPRIRRRSR